MEDEGGCLCSFDWSNMTLFCLRNKAGFKANKTQSPNMRPEGWASMSMKRVLLLATDWRMKEAITSVTT